MSGADGSLRPVLEAAGDTLTGERLRLVRRAHAVASHWHRDQRRRNGDPYVTHPVAVAAILAELGADHEMLCAALLHDVMPAGCPEAELVREFGHPIMDLVAGMYGPGHTDDRPAAAAAKADMRVLLLLLAHRLHNMRTLRRLPETHRREKSRQTLEIFAPIAGRLGLTRIEDELERLAVANLSAREGLQASYGVLTVAAILLPRRARARWLEEWLGELHALPGPRARLRFAALLLAGMPRLAWTLRGRGAVARPRPKPPASSGLERSPHAARDGLGLGRRAAGTAGNGFGAPRIGGAERVLIRGVRWLLISEMRTWALLGPLVAWLVLDTAAERLGDAVALLITVPPVLAAGVRALRARLGVTPRRR
ncbi:HD domain-containing protein [Nonomuraea sp. SYSU D8015]|uniref:HD domain-containing protein n=1 Tax=Nonomuraea sp. SYSU D8015 TaxID=2593644 RepID=UPI0016611ADA|nr:HD domain-containing protein [Nonomuraea sp. SYSU D8015]